MPYLIDGHNLVPKVGLQLDAIDDELELVKILQAFNRSHRKKIEVYFDGAPARHAGTESLGSIKAHFIQAGTTADSAIIERLKKLGRGARNWTVVSSDRQVQSAARKARARVVPSGEFARQLRQNPSEDMSSPIKNDEISSAEVDEWLKLFNARGQTE